MKSGCEFEELFKGYFNSDLSPAEELSLLNHLKSCARCSQKIEKFYQIHSSLKAYKRFAAPAGLLESYNEQVDLTFGRETLFNKIVLFFSRFGRKRSPLIRTIQILSLLIIGIIAGWLIFSPAEQNIVFHSNDPYQISKPVSSVDVEYIYYYLQAAEMVLLDIQNNSDPADLFLNREIAKKLLVKTLRVKEIALQINNLRLLNFLSHMELLLYEASNLNMEEMNESLDSLMMIIEEADLLNEVKTLQTLMKRAKDQIGA